MKKARKESSPRQPSKGSTAPSSKEMRPSRDKGVALYVVGMGGSAGGLEAFEQFFSHLAPDTGLAFVLVPPTLSRPTKACCRNCLGGTRR